MPYPGLGRNGTNNVIAVHIPPYTVRCDLDPGARDPANFLRHGPRGEHKQSLRCESSVSALRTESAFSHESDCNALSEQLADAWVICVANQNRGASSARPKGGTSKPLLVSPREHSFVVSNEAVVVMDDTVDGITINEITLSSPVDNFLEIARHELCSF